MANNNSYTGEQIEVLKGLEAVRKRPGMYIGNTAERGLHQLVYEAVDNAVDEALAGHATTSTSYLYKDNSCSVEDDGRGIPIDMHAEEKLPAVEVVMTILHAGGKFGKGGYKVSGGLHGVGISVVNALSEWMVTRVKRDGWLYEMSFERGITAQKLKKTGRAEGTGTIPMVQARYERCSRSSTFIGTSCRSGCASWRSSIAGSRSRCATSAATNRANACTNSRAASSRSSSG